MALLIRLTKPSKSLGPRFWTAKRRFMEEIIMKPNGDDKGLVCNRLHFLKLVRDSKDVVVDQHVVIYAPIVALLAT